MSRTDLSERQWRQLEPHLPSDPHRGHAYGDHRRVLNGILWRLKMGAPWRDVPARYGPWQTCYDRFVRWSRNGTWQRVLQLLQAKAGITYPSGRVLTYSRDAMGRIGSISAAKDGVSQLIVSQIAYQPFGGIQSFVNGAGKTVARGFDLDGRITSYTLGTTTQALGYDAASRISFISDAAVPANTGNYSYDDLDRLTQYTGPNNSQGFGYDATGNRISQVIGANTYSSTISPTSNRLAQITGPAVNNGYTYDANGSRINDASAQYGYDARGRMVSATTAQGVMQYQVNALGQRVQKSTPAGTTLYHYDGNGQLIGESTALGAFQKEYVYLNGMPVALFQ